jgi:alanine racemase
MARPLESTDPAPESHGSSRVLRPRRAAPAEAARATRAEINLAHVRHNLRAIQARLKADGAGLGRAPAQLWAVLKADGYGHGAAAVAITLENAGVDGICVALLEEGIELRNAGVRCPVLVMGGYYGRYRDGVEALIEHDLTPVVYDCEQIDSIASVGRFVGGRPPSHPLGVHLKVDTGMGRLGVRPEGLDAVLATLKNNRDRCDPRSDLRLEGLMTHLACADAASIDETNAQLKRFEVATARVRSAGFAPTLRHAANSAAMLRLPQSQLDAVRAGLAVFGVHPSSNDEQRSDCERGIKLRPVMRVLSEIVALRELPSGAALGYGHTWRAARPSRIATIPIGYADGLSRALSGTGQAGTGERATRGEVLICGKRAPIVGAVSMDLTMVDVTDIPAVSVRDEVVVLGEQRGRLGEDVITADELAAKTGTISWECLTSISRRVPRFYRHP